MLEADVLDDAAEELFDPPKKIAAHPTLFRGETTREILGELKRTCYSYA
jgi:hypothetical protein